MPSITKQTMKPKKRGTSVLDRIKPVSLVDHSVKMNLYGRSGTGKTTLACTFPKPLLLIGAEDGTKSVHNVKGVDFVRIQASTELGDLVELLKEGKYKAVVLDSASSLQDMILKEILGLEELPAQKSFGMASRDQYGQCALQTKERLRSLLDLPIDVAIIAQEKEFNTEGTGELLMPYVASALTPSVVGWLNPACDYIGQTFIREREAIKETKVGKKVVKTRVKLKGVDYCLRTCPHPVFTTKFRLPKGTPLPEVIVDPSYDVIAKLIRGES